MINYNDQTQRIVAEEKARELTNWAQKIKNMDGFPVPARYQVEDLDKRTVRFAIRPSDNKYNRFTRYIRNWIEEILAGDAEEINREDHKLSAVIEDLGKGRGELENDWWTVAKQIGSGKKVENNLPAFANPSDENKDKVYETFMPAYRALKESFEKRSIFEFIFNHRQYVAERDSLRAIEAVMTTLTGDGKAELQSRLDEYVNEIPSTDFITSLKEFNKRAEMQRNEALRAESGVVEKQETAADMNIEMQDFLKSEPSMEESVNLDEQPGVERLAANNFVQHTSISNSEEFEKQFVAEMKEAMQQQSKMADKMKTLFIETEGMSSLVHGAAFDFSDAMDEAINKRNNILDTAERVDLDLSDVEEAGEDYLDNVALDGVKNVFAKAYGLTKQLNLSLSDRIVLAQKFTDVTLNSVTPVGFQKESFGKFGDGYLLNNGGVEWIKNFVTEQNNEKESFSEQQIVDAVSDAVTTFNTEKNRVRMPVVELEEPKSGPVENQKITLERTQTFSRAK